MTNGHRLQGKPPHIISLIILSAFASMGAVLMTPALPSLAQYFNISTGEAQLTVTVFLLGYAIGQLFYGPIANRFGRKPAFYIGITISTLGSLFSILSSSANSFTLLVIGRCLEAVGSSVGLVVCYAVINDFYFPEKSREVVALMTLAFAIVPAVATAIGGLLTQFFHWQSCFYFLLIYGLVLIYPAATLPETLQKKDLSALKPRFLFNNYLKVFTLKKFVLFSVIFGFSTACSYLFSAEGPFIGIHLLHFSAGVYGLLGLTPAIGAILGSLGSAKCAGRFSASAIAKFGFILELAASLVMLISFALGWVNLYLLLIPMAILLMGHSILISNVSSLAMKETEDKANGSALMNFLCMAVAMIMTFVLGMSHTNGALVLPSLLCSSLVLMASTYFVLKGIAKSSADKI